MCVCAIWTKYHTSLYIIISIPKSPIHYRMRSQGLCEFASTFLPLLKEVLYKNMATSFGSYGPLLISRTHEQHNYSHGFLVHMNICNSAYLESTMIYRLSPGIRRKFLYETSRHRAGNRLSLVKIRIPNYMSSRSCCLIRPFIDQLPPVTRQCLVQMCVSQLDARDGERSMRITSVWIWQ